MHLDSLAQDTRRSPLQWLGSGEPLVWLNAAAVAISVLIVVGLLLLLATRGAAYFWPRDVLSATLSYQRPCYLVFRQ